MLDWLEGTLDAPDQPGIYAFLVQPGLGSKILQTVDNWFASEVCLYAGLAETQSLKARVADHKPKWTAALENKAAIEALGEPVSDDNLSVRFVVFADEAPIAEETFLKAVQPLAAKPFLELGGFGGKYKPADNSSWSLLGNLGVTGSPSLAERLKSAHGHTAPFLEDIALIEEFSRDQYNGLGVDDV